MRVIVISSRSSRIITVNGRHLITFDRNDCELSDTTGRQERKKR